MLGAAATLPCTPVADISGHGRTAMSRTGQPRLAILAAGPIGLEAALAAETVTYLFPAPPSLPAFGPIRLAKGKGYFTEAGIDVNFAVGRG